MNYKFKDGDIVKLIALNTIRGDNTGYMEEALENNESCKIEGNGSMYAQSKGVPKHNRYFVRFKDGRGAWVEEDSLAFVSNLSEAEEV